MAKARAPIARVIVLIALLCCAVVALRGHVPGAGPAAAPAEPAQPSALTLALMPVLLTVSVVILLAGVVASRHRLPLAVPEPEREREPDLGRLGPLGLLVVAGLGLLALSLAVGSIAYFFRAVQPEEPGTVERPAAPTSTGPVTTTGPVPDADTVPDGLSGTALLLTGVAAVVLLGAALVGLVLVALSSPRRERRIATPLEEPEEPSEVDSLARAAEMGLAAMNAPGQDPRTAIIACYVAMERGLSFDRAAAPLVSDTPMEVLARAFERGALRDASARELVALFEEARFSPHSMLEWQRMRAEQLLRIVLADLQGEMV